MLLTEEEVLRTLAAMQNERMERNMLLAKRLAEANEKVGEAFLAANKVKEGVVTLASGLQYKILNAGEGKKPTAADQVLYHYRGTFVDGIEFDSSYVRNQPATFAVNKAIKGWVEALQLMPVGSKWQLFTPPQLAYEHQGSGGMIGPNAALIFELELIFIQDKPWSVGVDHPSEITDAHEQCEQDWEG
jgi:FKBP-type peptidyl-prolyl cis-trans isomerase FklB